MTAMNIHTFFLQQAGHLFREATLTGIFLSVHVCTLPRFYLTLMAIARNYTSAASIVQRMTLQTI